MLMAAVVHMAAKAAEGVMINGTKLKMTGLGGDGWGGGGESG